MGFRILVFAFLAVMAIPRETSAQPSEDKVPSEEEINRLFDEGVSDMNKGYHAVGCPKIARSLALRPRPSKLFTLAECETGAGRKATGLALFEAFMVVFDALDPSEKQPPANNYRRSELAKERIAWLQGMVPRLTIVLPDYAPHGTVVTLDGVVLESARIGSEQWVDPGEHVVTIRVPGKPEREIRITLQDRDVRKIDLDIEVILQLGRQKARHDTSSTGVGSAWRPWAIGISAAVGTIGLATGISFAVASNHKAEASDAELLRLKLVTPGTDYVCSPAYRIPGRNLERCERVGALNDTRDTFRTVAIVGFAASGVAAGAAIIFALMPTNAISKKAALRVAPLVEPSRAGLSLGGLF